MEKQLKQLWLTDEEASLIEIVRKVLWGEVDVIIKGGEIKYIKKVVETFVFDRDTNKIKKE
jgi:hypothetical protein